MSSLAEDLRLTGFWWEDCGVLGPSLGVTALSSQGCLARWPMKNKYTYSLPLSLPTYKRLRIR